MQCEAVVSPNYGRYVRGAPGLWPPVTNSEKESWRCVRQATQAVVDAGGKTRQVCSQHGYWHRTYPHNCPNNYVQGVCALHVVGLRL